MFERKGMRHQLEILSEVLDHIDEQEKTMTDQIIYANPEFRAAREAGDTGGSDLGGENEVARAFAIIKQAMIDDGPEPGSYAHTWHCNIAAMCSNAMWSSGVLDLKTPTHEVYDVANDAASRFMKLAFDVETSN